MLKSVAFLLITVGLAVPGLSRAEQNYAEAEVYFGAYVPMRASLIPTNNPVEYEDSEGKRIADIAGGFRVDLHLTGPLALEITGLITPSNWDARSAWKPGLVGTYVGAASGRLLVGFAPHALDAPLHVSAGVAFILRRGERGALEMHTAGGVVAVGGKKKLSKYLTLRVDLDDYIYRPIREVIPPLSSQSTLHDIVLSAGLVIPLGKME